MNLSQFEEAVWHWRSSDGGPAEAGHHGRELVAAVEAVFELRQVAGDVLLADGPVGGGDGALDVAERSVDPLEGGCQHCLAAGSGRRASVSTCLRRKHLTRRSFRRTGWPSGVVSTAAMIGVLPGAPRPRLPPERSPPR